jgi:hypothetical protein
MMASGAYIERDEALIRRPLNKTFEEILAMSATEFRLWAQHMREEVARLWREENVPPASGFTIQDIEKQFCEVARYDESDLLVTDDLTGRQDCLLANSKIGSACRAFFPNMGKTKDIASPSGKGFSQWDLFTEPVLFDTFFKRVQRHFKRDGFYTYSRPVTRYLGSGAMWIARHHELRSHERKDRDFWLEPVSKRVPHYDPENPRNARERERRHLDFSRTVSKHELLSLHGQGLLPKRYFRNIEVEITDPDSRETRLVPFEQAPPSQRFLIRDFKKGQRIFPKGFRLFQTGLVLSGNNFPPLVAKYLYRRFTDDIKDQGRIILYDPSAGFGGRLLGALAASTDRRLHYVGTDPNPENCYDEAGMSRYEVLANFYHRNVHPPDQTTHEFFQLGSEVIDSDKRFQKYRGKVDLVFTSPPYFAAEGYSDDPNQSHIKFPTYLAWRDGFLKPTLETAVEWLRPGRYLLWNIADTKMGSRFVPLEFDSKAILDDLGMKYETKLKLVLARSPGANRFDKSGMPETKNFCMIGGQYRKYEPIFVFRKPR